MPTYNDVYNLRYSNELKNRVEVAVAKAAQDVLAEDAGTVNHTKRIAWAKNALVNSAEMAEKMMWGVVGNPTIATNGTASPDGDIQFVVNSLVDVFTGSV